MTDPLATLEILIGKALSAGADAADALYVRGESSSVSVRLGELEDIDRAEGADLGLRAFVGKRQAIVSSSDTREAALDEMAERCVQMARVAPEDPWCGLADKSVLALAAVNDLDIFDPTELSPETMENMAREAEDAARAVEGVTNSEGAGVSWSKTSVALATSGGFAGAYQSSSFSISASVLAGSDLAMERDYEYSSTRHLGDLESAKQVGRCAGERTVRRLNPRSAATGQYPVVFDSRVSNSLLGHLSGALNGRSVARGSSFLKDYMDKPVFAEGIRVIDDPRRKRGLRSRPFDGEGLAASQLVLVEDGVVRSWLLDCASARQLGVESNGHAQRGTSGPPSPGASNLYMAAGTLSPEDIMADIKDGFYVTELIGMGVNGVTGDYSRGAAGFWIENGELAFPVSELTIAGNLKDMYSHLTPASDLEFRYGTNAPTVRVEGMMVAGG